ncbi:hypothetical protein DFH28DRAFT_957060 [Melampsora americana]|nr:hypothetical protein DFH28DRAFT_957060 [Melampsora americana]
MLRKLSVLCFSSLVKLGVLELFRRFHKVNPILWFAVHLSKDAVKVAGRSDDRCLLTYSTRRGGEWHPIGRQGIMWNSKMRSIFTMR